MEQHRRTLKRYEALGDIRYLTCSCYRRLGLFQNDRIKDEFVQYLIEAKTRLQFHMYAWVLMPEHLHLLVRPANTQQSVAQILRGIKAGFAKSILNHWRDLDAPILRRITDTKARHRFWQTGGGYDRNLINEHEVIEKIAYIHQNPARHGLVLKPADWRWSSALAYESPKRYVGPEIDRLY